VARGTREDQSGEALVELLTEAGFEVAAREVVPDEDGPIEAALRRLAIDAELVVTTGGTGFGPRDRTPEVTRRVLEREAPGMAFLMVKTGLDSTPMAALSRGVVGATGRSLIVNLPGSPSGAVENLSALLPIIPHALQLLAGDTEHSPPAG
jgi:molybdenum cofactor synthesis domain-containing protein